ncbi:EF-hand domain-containing protein (plasmid) [Streptomyces sp. NBC_00080]|uniref:EF-hand domain-containing protein n=1 Tax=Streptomyces sp. NBC_00080 TaxID=2975645 RepID=UPI002F909561
MTTTVQDAITAKLERTFDILDADQDGYLDWADHQKLAERYITAYKLQKNDRRARALQAFLQTQWLELLRHAGVQGDKLTKAEYVTAGRLASIDTSRLNLADGAGHVIFDVIDVNQDNEINKDEFVRFLKDVWHSDAPDAMDVFAQLDSDGDGSISRMEFVRAVREYYLSGNADAPGSLFFGNA